MKGDIDITGERRGLFLSSTKRAVTHGVRPADNQGLRSQTVLKKISCGRAVLRVVGRKERNGEGSRNYDNEALSIPRTKWKRSKLNKTR
jgi:hypothetical protein